jgi:anthranilate synthase component 1
MHYPTFDRFQQLAAESQLVPVYRRLVSDSLTPVTAFHKLDAGPCACLFESVIGGEKVGRYSFLAAGPVLQLLAYGHRVRTLCGKTAEVREWHSDDPLADLQRLVADTQRSA